VTSGATDAPADRRAHDREFPVQRCRLQSRFGGGRAGLGVKMTLVSSSVLVALRVLQVG
jgi:hypothetical protein